MTGIAVVEAPGLSPIRGARATLTSLEGSEIGRTVTSDAEGRFTFANVRPGRYRLRVSKPGFLVAEYGATAPGRTGTGIVVSAERPNVDGLVLRLGRGAVLSGAVRTAAGSPLPGIRVLAMRAAFSFFGEPLLQVQGSTTTDDRGRYRLWGLTAGEYVVVALAAGAGWSQASGRGFVRLTSQDVDAVLRAPGPVAPPTGRRPAEAYAPVFAPGAADLPGAARFALGAGAEHLDADVVVAPVPLADVVGTVFAPPGVQPSAVSVALMRDLGAGVTLSGVPTQAPVPVRVDDRWSFVFSGVPAGRYSVVASAREPRVLWGRAVVQVAGGDARAAVELRPPGELRGSVVFDGSDPPPQHLGALMVGLAPWAGGGSSEAVRPGAVRADGTFVIANVFPGEYRIALIWSTPWGGRWTARSASIGGRDVLDAPVTLEPGDDRHLAIVFTDRPAEVVGQLETPDGRPASEYHLVAFSIDREFWTPGSRRVRSVRPALDGRFTIRGLPDGEYYLAAVADLDQADLRDRAFLEELAAAAIVVALAEGRPVTSHLRIRDRSTVLAGPPGWQGWRRGWPRPLPARPTSK